VHPWRDRAGDVRVALIVVVVHNGGGMPHATAGNRLAATRLCHLRHDSAVAIAKVPMKEALWRLCKCSNFGG
jgi:hypothetical protein